MYDHCNEVDDITHFFINCPKVKIHLNYYVKLARTNK